ncbi:hypothetical protein M758_1G252400 [Ceratodon purpureus]|nr:hypothetical protein M758_1G252400 [Ceratodon purpureus]
MDSKQFYQYLSDLLSDFPPLSILYMAANLEFEPMIQNARHWYQQETHDFLIREGLSIVHPNVRSTISSWIRLFLRVLCCVFMEPSRYSRIKVYSPRLGRIKSTRELDFFMELQAVKSDPYNTFLSAQKFVHWPPKKNPYHYAVGRGTDGGEEHISATYRRLLRFLDHWTSMTIVSSMKDEAGIGCEAAQGGSAKKYLTAQERESRAFVYSHKVSR